MAAFPSLTPNEVPVNLTAYYSASTGTYSPITFTIPNLSKQPSGQFDATNAVSADISADNAGVDNFITRGTASPSIVAAGVGTITLALTVAQLNLMLGSLGTAQGRISVALTDSIPNTVVVANGTIRQVTTA